MAELTPMMKQYLEIKKDNPDSILFFRLGDFYEMFADDAKLASRELDLTLTSRDHGKHAKPEEERVPMCGIPYHASEAYIARLIAKGYKVAICEQMEDPATAKGLVKRDIIRVVTPGTVIDAACLEEKASNFLCGIYIDSQNAGAAFCDISTGKTHLTAFSGPDRVEHVVNELGRFSPAEAVVNDGAASEKALTDALTEKFRCRVENGGEGRFRLAEAERNIRRQFGEEAFDRLVSENAFLEHATVHGHRYGTLRAPVERLMAEGFNVLLDIDPQGAITVMQNADDYVSVFILPPSFEDLRVRLHTRNTDDPVEIERRLKNARGEVQKIDRYQYAVVNDNLELAFAQLQSIANAEKHRTTRFHPHISEN